MAEKDIQFSLGEIAAKLDELLRRANSQDESRAHLSARVDNLERWRSYLVGAFAVISIATAAAFKLLT